MLPALAPRNDVAALAAEFAEKGSVSIAQFLELPSAHALADELESFDGWVEIFRAGEKVYEMAQADFAALPKSQSDELRRLIESSARDGLQYRYRTLRISESADERAARGRDVDGFADLLNQPQTIELLRAITGDSTVDFLDAQATDYRAGDFLTSHDDAVEGKRRRAAYVFGLTRRWQADWGGLLLFESDDRVDGFVPDFNVFRLFAVPAAHHVSIVAPWVEARRLSVTGWLRQAEPATN